MTSPVPGNVPTSAQDEQDVGTLEMIINALQQRLEQVENERDRMAAESAYWQQQTNHWYMKATYTPAELQAMYLRRSRHHDHLDENWLTPADHAAITAVHAIPTKPAPQEAQSSTGHA